MKIIKQFLLLIIIFLFVISCGTKTVNTDTVYLNETSLAWIPFQGDEQVTFISSDSNEVVYHGTGKNIYFENVLYETEQTGFFSSEKNYYADMERIDLIFQSDSLAYNIKYYLETNKGSIGDWDIFKLSFSDKNFSILMKKIVYYTDDWDYGEHFEYADSITINDNKYYNVYYFTQLSRPYEIYYTQTQGVVGFRLSDYEIWSLKIEPDTTNNIN
ncbi:MAG: hypothetical protein K8R58_05690 [Bacteroidales bacterium]|nr:hypothetical protein [Bacteroidales bacterium]